jgi:hypothetical protein
MFEGVRLDLFLEGRFSALGPSFSWSTHSLHNYWCNNSRCFRRAKIPFIVLYVMMHFLGPTLGAIGPYKRHLKMFKLVRSRIYFQRGQTIGCKKGSSCGILAPSLRKVSLLCQHCPSLICIHGCGICNWHGGCSWRSHSCGCANLKIQF